MLFEVACTQVCKVFVRNRKYKVTDIAKDFGISTKKVIETFAELTGETRKTGATFEESEVNAQMCIRDSPWRGGWGWLSAP